MTTEPSGGRQIEFEIPAFHRPMIPLANVFEIEDLGGTATYCVASLSGCDRS